MDKDILRIVIILLGIAVMVGMVVWSMFKNRKPRGTINFYDKKDPLGKIDENLVLDTENDNFDVVPLGAASTDKFSAEPDPIFNDNIQHPEPSDFKDETVDPEIETNIANELGIDDFEEEGFDEEGFAPVEPKDQQPRFELPKIIQINILALEYDGFKGKDLLEVFKQAKLEYGSLKIFERLDELRRVDFAVASMVEPGTFPETEMDSFTCPGIVFFLQPAELDHPLEVFNDFIETIEMIATKLDGVKLDQKREPLSKESINEIRMALAAL